MVANLYPVCLIAGVSHELRTPLNAVLGFLQLLRAGAGTERERERYLAHAHCAAQHLADVVKDLMELSSIEAGTVPLHLGAVRVAEVAAEAMAMVAPSARELGMPLLLDEGDLAACAWADRLRLRQILLNLLANAIKYNRRGRAVHVGWRTHAGVVMLAVRDGGTGLRAEQLAHLFEPFNRLGAEHTEIEGTGIGLAIARGLARLMRGDIEVDSEPEGGSTFRVVLPSTST